jgi:hypothetical protein
MAIQANPKLMVNRLLVKGFKPLILGLRAKCSTTLPLWHNGNSRQPETHGKSTVGVWSVRFAARPFFSPSRLFQKGERRRSDKERKKERKRKRKKEKGSGHPS